MPEIILSDYFYGDESEEFVYFKIPRQLITNPKFKHISTDAKLLYGMLLDRMSLSARNDWYDSDTSYITHSNSGEGLLFYGNVTIPFVDRFPKGEIYNLLTTRPEDIANDQRNE